MLIDVNIQGEREISVDLEKIRTFSEKVLVYLENRDVEISIIICDNCFIKTLNRDYRNIDEATDVLSFSQMEESDESSERSPVNGGGRHLGDIIVSEDMVQKNAAVYNVTVNEEMKRLIVHGILHLNGINHETPDQYDRMMELQEKIIETLREDDLY